MVSLISIKQHLPKMFLVVAVLICVMFGAVNVLPDLILQVPPQTYQLTKSDVIICLGTPANKFGKPSPVMRERVKEAVRLWKEGYAKYIIFSGRAAHNKFVEAEVMSDMAKSCGVSDASIVLEPNAQNTYQNAFESVALMQSHGWKSAIVVSSPAHLRRSNFIFSHYQIKYCVDGCKNPPEQSAWALFQFDQREKLHVLTAVMLGQSSTFGLTPGPSSRPGGPDAPSYHAP